MAGEAAVLAPEKPKTDIRTVDITVEMGNSRNQNFQWALSKQELRGRWSRVNLSADEHGQELGQLPEVIPGMRIRVSGKDRTIRVYDPLDTPEFRDLWEQVRRMSKQLPSIRTDFDLTKAVEQTGCSDDIIKTAMYHIHRWSVVPWKYYGESKNRKVGGPCVIHVAGGKIPTLEEIEALPGKVRTEIFNTGNQVKRVRDTVLAASD